MTTPTTANDNRPLTVATSDIDASRNRPAEFDAKLAQYMPAIRNLAQRFQRDDKDDLVQEIVVFCLRNWANFRSDGSFYMWLACNARSLAQNRYRRDNKRDKVFIGDPNNTYASIIGIAPTQHQSAELSDVLAALPAGREGQILLRRAYGDGLSEIAADLGISRERVRQLEERARATLVRTLGRAYADKRAAA